MNALESIILQDAIENSHVVLEEDMDNTSDHFNDYCDEEDVFSNNDENDKEKEKIHKLRIHSGKVTYYRKIANNLVKVEAYTSPCNAYSYIRDPYTGALLPDRVGSRDELYYFKAKMPCIGTGDDPIIFYYPSPEAFERHHLVTLPVEIINEWKRTHICDNIVDADNDEDTNSNEGMITVK